MDQDEVDLINEVKGNLSLKLKDIDRKKLKSIHSKFSEDPKNLNEFFKNMHYLKEFDNQLNLRCQIVLDKSMQRQLELEFAPMFISLSICHKNALWQLEPDKFNFREFLKYVYEKLEDQKAHHPTYQNKIDHYRNVVDNLLFDLYIKQAPKK